MLIHKTHLYHALRLTIVSVCMCVSFFVCGQKLRKDIEQANKGFVTKDVDKNLFEFDGSDADFYFIFPNINVVPYYFNHKELTKIKNLETKGDQVELIKALEAYVRNFGIENFSQNTDMIWKLAQLYESNGMIPKAKAAYRLVLKHHRTEVVQEILQYFKIKEHYDELTELEKENYVPLNYYYELVEYRKLIDTLRPPKSILTNMGELVNKRNVPDYGPSISLTDSVLIFTRRVVDRKVSGQKEVYSEKLFTSKNYGGTWDEASQLPSPISSSCNEGSACMSSDGKTIFFSRCQQEKVPNADCLDCLGSCDIYTSTYIDGAWTKPKNLGVNVNSSGWDSHPSLSLMEDTLYFASSRLGGFGLTDIYFTVKDEEGNWSKAKNMGPMINTRNAEYSPFINKTYNVFYFSSNGQLFNFDDVDHKKVTRTLDIYKCYHHGHHFTEPKNVGPLVNGKGNEFYFTIDSKAKFLYYARTEEETKDELKTDLFSFPVPMEAQPNARTKLKGSLKDASGKPYKGIVSIIDMDNGIEVAPKSTRSDGSYEFDLIDNNNYLLVIQGDEFFRIEKLFHLDGDTAMETEAVSVQNRKLTFSSLEFENGKAEIRPEMEADLKNVIDFLVDNPGFNLKISGHTDSQGNAQANMSLSQRRADAIKKHLEEQGYIVSERIEAVGYGSTKPLKTPEVTNEDRKLNRRVEFEIFTAQKKEPTYKDEDFQDNTGESGDW